jgi:DNA-binding response OmpR family regulator
MNEPADLTGTTAPILLISRDLFFSSKITGTAAGLGIHVEVAGDLQRVAERTAAKPYACWILDLSVPDLVVADVMAALPPDRRTRVIAFGPHVATARLQEARDAGCDEVMPRSRFTSTLADVLRKNASPTADSDSEKTDTGSP